MRVIVINSLIKYPQVLVLFSGSVLLVYVQHDQHVPVIGFQVYVLAELLQHQAYLNDAGLPATQVVPIKTHIEQVDKLKLGKAQQ
ncbi:hypothetical protein pb186bvf_019214, partial [Paramecium bursaria]